MSLNALHAIFLNMKTLTKIKNHNSFLNHISDLNTINFDDFKEYDFFRLVNPETKEVFCKENNTLKKLKDCCCYDIWNTGEPCKYCVSTNALEAKCEKKKLEYLDNNLFLARVIPVTFKGTVLVLELFQNLADTYLKTSEKFEQISDIVTKLNELASLDSFTKLYSHSYIINKLEIFLNNKMNINRETVTLVQLDINKLKFVNDNFGHTTGDELILKVAEILNPLKSIKHIFPGRTGGDEFQILLLNFSYNKAHELLKPYLNALQSLSLSSTDYKASVSYGYLEWNQEDSSKIYIDKVDKLMYSNKKTSNRQGLPLQ